MRSTAACAAAVAPALLPYVDGLRARFAALRDAGLDAQIAAQRKLSTIGSPADRQKALTEIELLERQKGDIRRKVAREAVEAQREIDKQLEISRGQEKISKDLLEIQQKKVHNEQLYKDKKISHVRLIELNKQFDSNLMFDSLSQKAFSGQL